MDRYDTEMYIKNIKSGSKQIKAWEIEDYIISNSKTEYDILCNLDMVLDIIREDRGLIYLLNKGMTNRRLEGNDKYFSKII